MCVHLLAFVPAAHVAGDATHNGDDANNTSAPRSVNETPSDADWQHGVLLSATHAFRYAREHVVMKGETNSNCGWTRSTYMIGLWQYYAATVYAKAPDLDAEGDLRDWGRILNYTLCTAPLPLTT